MKTFHILAALVLISATAFAGALDGGGGIQGSGIQGSSAQQVYTLNGTVFQRTSDGLIVQTKSAAKTGAAPRGMVFVTGAEALNKFDGNKISVRVVANGTYNYDSVGVGEKVIQSFAVAK